jgi:hypothetical protein
MRKLAFAAALATSLAAGLPVSALAQHTSGTGFDIGPLGQCMNPPDCGGRRANASQCPMVRERVVTPSGHVTFRRHRVCS